MQVADPNDVAALEWLEVEIRTADARRPRVVDELAQAVSVVLPPKTETPARSSAPGSLPR